MKSFNQTEWSVVQLGSGKFAPRVSRRGLAPYWPYEGIGGQKEFDTLEQAKEVLLNQKAALEKKTKDREEKVVFSII